MKKLLTLTLTLLVFCASAKSQTALKWNAAYWMVGVVNMSVETSLGNKLTFNADVVYSPWESVKGNHLRLMQIIPELRYYPWGSFNKFYVGVYAAHHQFFKLTKWNYMNSGKYQMGNGFAVGATVGCQLPLARRWNMDVYAGFGWQHSGYRGYYSSGEMYVGWNRSAEWMPYKLGIAFAYRLGMGNEKD